MAHVLLVVSRDAPGLLARLTKEFAGVEGIKVVSDRRIMQRRHRTDRGGAERRRSDRRKQPTTDPRLTPDAVAGGRRSAGPYIKRPPFIDSSAPVM